MRRIFSGVTVALLCACGSSSSGGGLGPADDFAPNFVGTWTGTFNESAGMQQVTGTAAVTITETLANTIFVVGCADNTSGPSATTTSATEFSLTAAYSCPAYNDPSVCASIILSYTSLTGGLTGTTLAFTANVNVAGCGVSVDGTISLSGATKGPGNKE